VKFSKVQHTIFKENDDNSKEQIDKKKEEDFNVEEEHHTSNNYSNENNVSNSSSYLRSSRSYVFCTDVIDYFNQDIINANKVRNINQKICCFNLYTRLKIVSKNTKNKKWHFIKNK
jgi:hypothetical protein